MNNISVALAVYNEEEKLPKCLQSVSGWVDEIVIVDGNSTDKTIEIAKKYKAKIIHSDNPKNFHINKKKAIVACTFDWILQLDADEVVSKELKGEITKTIHSQSTIYNLQQMDGYWIPRRNYFLGTFLKKGGQYPDYTLRLYRKGKGMLSGKNVHEQAIVTGTIGYLHASILHFSYTTFSEYLDHFNRYTSLFAREYKEQKIPIGWYSFVLFFIIKPFYWFFLTYFRHRGYVDGFPGFIFSFFSSLRFPVSYIKYWETK